jgi:hypothetical protein
MQLRSTVSILSLFLLGLVITLLLAVGTRLVNDRADEVQYKSRKLVVQDGAVDDRFGSCVAIDGDVAVVGAPFGDNSEPASGCAYMYRTSGDKWHVQTLRADAVHAGDLFGSSVAICGKTAIVGAREDPSMGHDAGAAYVFQADADGIWVQTAKLTASDARAQNFFGHCVDVSGQTAIVGAPFAYDRRGGAYLFQDDGTGNWKEIARLQPGNANAYNFGWDVAISGNRAAVGTQRDVHHSTKGSAAYVFEWDDSGRWKQVDKLLPYDAATESAFGIAVALDEDTLVVGAPEDCSRQPFAGAAYMFRPDAQGVWRQIAKLTADDAKEHDYFGCSVAIRRGVIAIGSVGRNKLSGAAFLYATNGNDVWKLVAKFTANRPHAGDRFGTAVDIGTNSILVGTPMEDIAKPNAGSAYVFSLNWLR